MAKKIVVLGAGGWGITLSILLEKAGNEVILWEPLPETCEILLKERQNTLYFPGFSLPPAIHITGSMEEAIGNSEIGLIALRSVYFRKAVSGIRKIGKEMPFVIATKGIEIQSCKTMSEVLTEELGSETVCGSLSGPTIAREIASGKPSAAVIATRNRRLARIFQDLFDPRMFRIYSSTDIKGVEIGGAFKNVLAVGAGIIDGLELGVNTKAAYLARALNEMINIGLALGAREKTFRGLSGIGDLITTSFSMDSRNRSFGQAIVKEGKKEYLSRTRTVIEGIPATEAFYRISRKESVEMPITGAIYNIIFRDRDPLDEIRSLMDRQLKDE